MKKTGRMQDGLSESLNVWLVRAALGVCLAAWVLPTEELRAGNACCHQCTGQCLNMPDNGYCQWPFETHVGVSCQGIRACFFPGGPSACIEVDGRCCADLGGTPGPAKSHCADSSVGACCNSAAGTCALSDASLCIPPDETFNGVGSICGCSEQACCSVGACANKDTACCTGTPAGPGTQCAGVQACCNAAAQPPTCSNIDAVCCSGTPGGTGSACDEACCLDSTTTPCVNASAACCQSLGGLSRGAGTCASLATTDDTCASQACCIADYNHANTFCQTHNYVTCIEHGGTPQGLDQGIETECDGMPDTDGDGAIDLCDNCVAEPNATDDLENPLGTCILGLVGTAGCTTNAGCDSQPGLGDGFCSVLQEDTDECSNGGSACLNDADCAGGTCLGDGTGDVCDNCPQDLNADQLDGDDDGVGYVCDNCPTNTNADQFDCDNDGAGDVCDSEPPDRDSDGRADPCDDDDDNDTIPDLADVCDFTPLGTPRGVPQGVVTAPPTHRLLGTVYGDVDGDCDRDQNDLNVLQQLTAGSLNNGGSNFAQSCP